MGGLFELRLEPEELAKDIEYSADLFVFGMAKIDQPLGDASSISRLTLAAEGKGAANLEGGPSQAVTREEGSPTCQISIGADAAPPVAASADEIEEALAETVEHPIGHEEVVALAQEAVGDAATPAAKVERLVAFVGQYIADDYTGNPLTVLDIIQQKRGDCTEHALLFATLARAVGVPAREVSGLVYMGDEVQSFGGHAWNEVVVDGHWQPVDAAWGETTINATHIRFGAGRGQEGKMLSILGGVTFTLVDVARKE
jgi:transglutaminase-like putative cysteine protease